MEFRGVLATCDCFISALAYSVCLVMDGWVFGRTMVFGVSVCTASLCVSYTELLLGYYYRTWSGVKVQ